MHLPGWRPLARVLQYVVDAAIVGFAALLVFVLFFMAKAYGPDGPHVQQGSVYVELKLPTELAAPVRSDIEVFNLESSRSKIHYVTESIGPLDTVLTFTWTIVGFGLILWILWLLHRILASVAAGRPLTEANATRFRAIGVLLIARTLFAALGQTMEYLDLQRLFEMIPNRDFLDLYIDHFDVSDVFLALLVLLMAVIMRLGAEHRMDSEAVI